MKKLLLLFGFLTSAFLGYSQIPYNAKIIYLAGSTGTLVKDTSNYCVNNPCPNGSLIWGAVGGDTTVYVRLKGKWIEITATGAGVTANNGLTKTGSTIQLGGALLHDTNITGGHQLSLTGILNVQGSGLVSINSGNPNNIGGSTGLQLTTNSGNLIFNPNGTINAQTEINTTSSSTLPALNLGAVAGDPSTLVNGSLWYNSSTNKFRGRENGSSVNIVNQSATPISSVQVSDGAGGFSASTNGNVSTTYDGSLGLVNTKNTGTNSTSFITKYYSGEIDVNNGLSPTISSVQITPTQILQNVAGQALTINSGTGGLNLNTATSSSGTAGTVAIAGGNGTAVSGGPVTVTGGSATSGGTPGSVTISGGASTGTQPAGTVNINGGSGSGSASNIKGGTINITPGAGHGTGGAGNLVMGVSTTGSTTQLFGGADIQIQSNGTAEFTASVGPLKIDAPTVNVAPSPSTAAINIGSSAAGTMNIQTGNDNTLTIQTTGDGFGGGIVIQSGGAGITMADGGTTNPIVINGTTMTVTTTGDVTYAVGSNTGVVPLALSGSATLDFPNTTTGVSDLTVTVTGATLGDRVAIGVPNASLTATATFWGWVSASNTVTIRFSPKAVGGENPASGTFNVYVFK